MVPRLGTFKLVVLLSHVAIKVEVRMVIAAVAAINRSVFFERFGSLNRFFIFSRNMWFLNLAENLFSLEFS